MNKLYIQAFDHLKKRVWSFAKYHNFRYPKWSQDDVVAVLDLLEMVEKEIGEMKKEESGLQ